MAVAKKKDDTEKKEKKQRQGGRFGVITKDKQKLIPPFVMLTAGAVSSILMVMQGRYELHEFLRNLLLILLCFYILGCVLKETLDLIRRQNMPPEPEEDDVIEKEPEEQEQEQAPEEETVEE